MAGWEGVGASSCAPSFTPRIAVRVGKRSGLPVVINLLVILSVIIASVAGMNVVSPSDNWWRLAPIWPEVVREGVVTVSQAWTSSFSASHLHSL